MRLSGSSQRGSATLEHVGVIVCAALLVTAVGGAVGSQTGALSCRVRSAEASVVGGVAPAGCRAATARPRSLVLTPRRTAPWAAPAADGPVTTRLLSEGPIRVPTPWAAAPGRRALGEVGQASARGDLSWYCLFAPWFCLPDIDTGPQVTFPTVPAPSWTAVVPVAVTLPAPQACLDDRPHAYTCLATQPEQTPTPGSLTVDVGDGTTLALDPTATSGTVEGLGTSTMGYGDAVAWCDANLSQCGQHVRAASDALVARVEASLGIPPDCLTPAQGRQLLSLTARQVTVARYATVGLTATAIATGTALGTSGHPWAGIATGTAIAGLGVAINLWLDGQATAGQPGLNGQELVAVRQVLAAAGPAADQLEGQGEMLRNLFQVLADWAGGPGNALAVEQMQHGGAGQQLEAAQNAVAEIENQAAAVVGGGDPLSCDAANQALATERLIDASAERSNALP